MPNNKKAQDLATGFPLIGKPSAQDIDPELEAMLRAAFPIDRSLEVRDAREGGGVKKHIDQSIVDAFSVEPVFSDYTLVSNKPTAAELGAMLEYNSDNGPSRIPIYSDDFLIIVSDDGRIEQLLTISTIPITGSVAYEVSVHSFKMDLSSILALWLVRYAIGVYGVISYPDSDLIDEHCVDSFGNGVTSYLSDTRRTRPVFITRKASMFSRKERDYLKRVMTSLSVLGIAIASDKLFREYGEQLGAGKLDVIAVPPIAEYAIPDVLRKNEMGLLPTGLDYFLSKSPLRQPDWAATDRSAGLGPHAKKIFADGGVKVRTLNLDEVRIRGQRNEESLAETIAEFDQIVPARRAQDDVHQDVPEEIAPPEEIQEASELVLDSDGYPADAKDLAIWADRVLGDKIVILPRARQALRKFQHPEPGRLAQALELLAGPKLKTYRGDRTAQEEVNSKLLSLRMRDGFSNAERLRGQKGDAYIVRYGGKIIPLSRHLTSFASGFNDPRLIRIYYFYDKASRKIVIGWLPTHLPTSQS